MRAQCKQRSAPLVRTLSGCHLVLPSDSSPAAGLNLLQTPHDVRFLFPTSPGAQDEEVELWAKSDFLSRSSDYFKTLLSSDFAETVDCRSRRARQDDAAACDASSLSQVEEKDHDDSDDETDSFLFSQRPPKPSSSPFPAADDLEYRQITISQTAYSTYHSLLVYLQTGFIHFVPLSSFLHSPQARIDFLSAGYDKDPLLPLPASVKSAYRLAHLLSLDELQQLCLSTLPSSLSPSNAGVELFSDTLLAYDAWRKVILDYVKLNWEKVRVSDEWKAKMRELKSGEGASAGATAVSIELVEAVTGL
jgi:hypothetical protein